MVCVDIKVNLDSDVLCCDNGYCLHLAHFSECVGDLSKDILYPIEPLALKGDYEACYKELREFILPIFSSLLDDASKLIPRPVKDLPTMKFQPIKASKLVDKLVTSTVTDLSFKVTLLQEYSKKFDSHRLVMDILCDNFAYYLVSIGYAMDDRKAVFDYLNSI